VVTGQAGIGLSDGVDAFIMVESSADHNAEEHKIFSRMVGLTCGDIVAGTGFTIHAETELRLTGAVKVQWVWSA